MGKPVQPLYPEQAPERAAGNAVPGNRVLSILVVGNLASWRKAGREIPRLPGFHFTAFDDVTAELLRVTAPDLVLSALMGDGYDAIELARCLALLDFAGRYRALTSGLPNPRVVLAEVHQVAPGIDFDLFDLDGNLLLRR